MQEKVIVANKDILKGELFNEDNLTAKRSNKGINPMKWNKIVNKVRAKKEFFYGSGKLNCENYYIFNQPI